MKEILLNKNKGKLSVNVSNAIPVEISRDSSMFHNDIWNDTIDTLEVYNNEKDASNKHRFIVTVYPICTNILFNRLTEIVYKEGSDECMVLGDVANNRIPKSDAVSTSNLDRLQAIRNTEYSNDIFNLTYHCGGDIFNNHLLRSKETVSVQKRKAVSKCDFGGEKKDAFNTIGDYCRDNDGNLIKNTFPDANREYTYVNGGFTGNTPLYMYDTIKPFETAFKDGLKRKEGWLGFYNPTKFHMPVKEGYYVNKCINNRGGCEFIEMTPERDLFSFTPKKNPYRKRLEYNWDYWLTYPYQNEYDMAPVLIGKGKGLPLMPYEESDFYISANNVKCIRLKSPVKHNLAVNNSVALKDDRGETIIVCKVVSLGDENGKYKDYFFSVRKGDFEINDGDSFENFNLTRYSKYVGGLECDYYFRRFKKVKEENLRNEINRLAFADTIYGDEITQIVFTDDVNIDGLKDNMNRPLSEIYLTVKKTNRGHNEWDSNPSDEAVEYSHVFGSVTSGLDVPPFVLNNTDFPILRRLSNAEGYGWPSLNEDLDNEIGNFLGDLVEFNPITAAETVLENVMHRFNTVQREKDGQSLFYDEIKRDQYDGEIYGSSNVADDTQIEVYEGMLNVAPEGYIYQPHHKIKIGEFSDTLRQLSDTIINTEEYNLKYNANGLFFLTNRNYGLIQNEKIVLMDKNNTHETYMYQVMSYKRTEDGNVYACECVSIDGKEINGGEEYWFFRHKGEIPDYAYMMPDGSGRCLWRDMVKPSALSFRSDLYNVPFTNGAFYHHTNITFPVRRQDPFGEYGLNRTDEEEGINKLFNIASDEADLSYDEYIKEMEGKTCF